MAAWRFPSTSTLCAARVTCSRTRPNGPAWTHPSRPARPGRSRTCCGTPATSTGGRPGTSPNARRPSSTGLPKRRSCAAARPTPNCSPGSAPATPPWSETLTEADPALVCAIFMAAPSPLAFWARRQAHETAIHRADAEIALGAWPDYPPDFAADGVDELIIGFGQRRRYRPSAETGGSLQVRATDTGHAWHVGHRRRPHPGPAETPRPAAGSPGLRRQRTRLRPVPVPLEPQRRHPGQRHGLRRPGLPRRLAIQRPRPLGLARHRPELS